MAEHQEPNNGNQDQRFQQAIDNLEKKKAEVLSDHIIQAKKVYDKEKQLADGRSNMPSHYYDELIESIHLLAGIFKESSFDTLATFLANPGRVLTVNLFIGIMRGIGFAIGLGMVIVVLAYLFRDSAYPYFALIQGEFPALF